MQTNYDYPENLQITICEYIWIDGSGKNLRSCTKILHKQISIIQDIEWIVIDGQQSYMDYENIYLKPVFMCPDPFRKQKNAILVLTETYLQDKKTPHITNFRHLCNKIMQQPQTINEEPWFGIEQEYMMFTSVGTTHQWPLNWPRGGFPAPMGPYYQYYCSVGQMVCFGRAMTEAHIRCCLYSGIKISGLNGEAVPAQWEYQIGITKGIEGADMLWISRYILIRLGEEFGVQICFCPKPFKGDWKGQGGHINYSTKSSRVENGLDIILDEYIPRLHEKHMEHIELYGEGNQFRLQGSHDASIYDKFNVKECSREASIRIPLMVQDKQTGYLEDRRPASNLEPYLALSIVVDTTVLDSEYCDEILYNYKLFFKYQRKKGLVQNN